MACGYSGISLITCFTLVFFGVDAVSDELPQPENLSLSRSSDLSSLNAQWNKPRSLDANCTVRYLLNYYSEDCPPSGSPKQEWKVDDLNFTWIPLNNVNNKVCVSVTTTPENCASKKQSKSIFQGLSKPALVKHFTCVYYLNMKMNCSWSLISNTSDLQLFYRRRNETRFKPCVSYIGSRPVWTGCHLFGEEFVNDVYFFLANGTLDGVPVQNSFMRNIKHLKIPPPILNITREGKYLTFQSTEPDFQHGCWEYEFHYRKCNEEYSKTQSYEIFIVEYDEACKYTVQVKTHYFCGEGGSEMSEPVSYGQDNNPNITFNTAMIVTPIIVSCCLIAVLVLLRRHKDYIFPEIPEPSLLFKDELDHNGEKGLDVGKLYVPYEDAVVKKFSLEPENTFLHTGVLEGSTPILGNSPNAIFV